MNQSKKPISAAENEKARQGYFTRSTTRPLIVKNVGDPKLMRLTPRQLAEVILDREHYQRPAHRPDIVKYIHVLREGGYIPPIALAQRADGAMACLDGQQRLLAASEAGVAIWAVVVGVSDVETEQELFLVENASRSVRADYIVRAHTGPVAEMLRKAVATPGSQLHGVVTLDANSHRWSAALMVRMAAIVMTRTLHGGPILEQLAQADALLVRPGNRDRVEGIWSIAAAIFDTTQRLRSFPATCLALAVSNKWGKHVVFPSAAAYRRMRAINWSDRKVIPFETQEYVDRGVRQIVKYWRTDAGPDT